MARIRRFDEKRFITLNFLTEILDSVKKYLPDNFEYVKIWNERVGHQQGSLHLTFYDNSWRNITDKFGYEFTEDEQEIYYEECLSDYINNSLPGMNQDCKLINWKHSDEFFDKVHLDDDPVYYEYPNSKNMGFEKNPEFYGTGIFNKRLK